MKQTTHQSVDRRTDRLGRRLMRPAPPFLALACCLTVAGVILLIVAWGWAWALGIVLVALAGFVATAPVGMLIQGRRRALVPYHADALPLHETTEELHGHVHGPGCGHLAIEHGDHVDYVHDGHRHARHGGHVDDH